MTIAHGDPDGRFWLDKPRLLEQWALADDIGIVVTGPGGRVNL